MIPQAAKNAAQDINRFVVSKDERGLDEIIKFLTSHSNEMRQKIKRAYRTMYKEELIDDVNKAYKGHDKVLEALLDLPEDYDAKELFNSMKGVGTREAALTELLCSRTNKEIEDAHYAYRHWFGKTLKADVIGDTSGEYKEMLENICDRKRDENGRTDRGKASHTVNILQDKKNKDENFASVLTTQSYPQICEVAEQYEQSTGKSFEEAIKKEFGGDAEFAGLSIFKVARYGAPAYFAELIHDSVKKGHTDVLLRICGGREEKDLVYTKQAFMDRYHVPLENFANEHIKDKKHHVEKEVCLALLDRAHDPRQSRGY